MSSPSDISQRSSTRRSNHTSHEQQATTRDENAVNEWNRYRPDSTVSQLSVQTIRLPTSASGCGNAENDVQPRGDENNNANKTVTHSLRPSPSRSSTMHSSQSHNSLSTLAIPRASRSLATTAAALSGEKEMMSRRRFESVARVVTVDTSRAKSNANVVRMCLQKLRWKDYPNGRDGRPCHIYWHNIVYSDLNSICKPGSKVNKFPGMNELARKAALTRCLNALWRLYPNEYNFFPRSWLLPEQREEFLEEHGILADEQPPDRRPWYIVKPDDGAQGDGIYLLQKTSELRDHTEPHVIQEYMAYPYLLNDCKKFDLRVYVVIKSMNPLSIHVYKEGMARFATQAYNRPTEENRHQPFMHLTNYSLNKNNTDYVHATDLSQEGSKRLLTTVFHQMEARGVNTRKVWHHIKLLIVKTVLSMLPEMMLYYEHTFTHASGPQCFQILGFDILLLEDLQPILLEINACPSLSLAHDPQGETESLENLPPTSSVVDEAIKFPLVLDTLRLIMDETDGNTRFGSAIERSPLSVSPSMLSIDEQLGTSPSTLVEIFPSTYQTPCQPFLILDKAAYLFMHFVNIRRTMLINQNNTKLFLRKCHLQEVISGREVDTHFLQLQRRYNRIYARKDKEPEAHMTGPGMSFHGFVELLMIIASRYMSVKRPPARGPSTAANRADLEQTAKVEAFETLIEHCVVKLRHHGVTIEGVSSESWSEGMNEADVELLPPSAMNDRSSRQSSSHREVYMLPSRVSNQVWRQKEIQQQQVRRQHRMAHSSSADSGKRNGGLQLPKIKT